MISEINLLQKSTFSNNLKNGKTYHCGFSGNLKDKQMQLEVNP